METEALVIRRARRDDLESLGRLGALLLCQHHEFDPRRFMAPGRDPASGYGWFLATQLDEQDAAVFVAERDGRVVGYAYATVEPRSWQELREEAGFLHDLVVEAGARGAGVGTALLDAAALWLTSRGQPRIVLWSAARNEPAQQFFARHGFRPTMVEMTREL